MLQVYQTLRPSATARQPTSRQAHQVATVRPVPLPSIAGQPCAACALRSRYAQPLGLCAAFSPCRFAGLPPLLPCGASVPCAARSCAACGASSALLCRCRALRPRQATRRNPAPCRPRRASRPPVGLFAVRLPACSVVILRPVRASKGVASDARENFYCTKPKSERQQTYNLLKPLFLLGFPPISGK